LHIDSEGLRCAASGRFLAILEVILHFDPSLKNPPQNMWGQRVGKSLYMSSTNCDELMEFMGKDAQTTGRWCQD
jgi:hypothetical protein